MTKTEAQYLIDSFNAVCQNYGDKTNTNSIIGDICTKVWNAIKHIFNQSDWQVARDRFANLIELVGDKNNNAFKYIIYPELKENTFTFSEAREIADEFLTEMVRKTIKKTDSHQAFAAAVKTIHLSAGLVLFRQLKKNPERFPKILEDTDFQQDNYKGQLNRIYIAAGGQWSSFGGLIDCLDGVARRMKDRAEG